MLTLCHSKLCVPEFLGPRQERHMAQRIAALLALALALVSASALACPGDKVKSDGKADSTQPTQPKPTT